MPPSPFDMYRAGLPSGYIRYLSQLWLSLWIGCGQHFAIARPKDAMLHC